MSKFDMFRIENVLIKSLIKQGDKLKLYRDILMIILSLCILCGNIFTTYKIIIYTISGIALLFLLSTLYFNYKYNRIINQIAPNSVMFFNKSKITIIDNSKDIDIEATDITRITLKRGVLGENLDEYKFAIVDIECKELKLGKLIIYTISKDEDKHDLFHTLEVFTSFNRISYQNEIKFSR